jgi:hypothetical protein
MRHRKCWLGTRLLHETMQVLAAKGRDERSCCTRRFKCWVHKGETNAAAAQDHASAGCRGARQTRQTTDGTHALHVRATTTTSSCICLAASYSQSVGSASNDTKAQPMACGAHVSRHVQHPERTNRKRWEACKPDAQKAQQLLAGNSHKGLVRITSSSTICSRLP